MDEVQKGRPQACARPHRGVVRKSQLCDRAVRVADELGDDAGSCLSACLGQTLQSFGVLALDTD
jgi:hypothetical protein